MATDFGRRGLRGAPSMGHPAPKPPPRLMRSRVVVIGAVGALALSVAGAAEWRQERCRQRPPDDPDPRPTWCNWHAGSHSSGRSFFSGGGGSIGHASFGGFGAHGFGHGGG